MTILPSESRTLSALGTSSTSVRQTDARSTVLRGGSVFRDLRVPERLEDCFGEGARVPLLVLDVYGVHRAYRSDNGTGMGARVP